MPWVMYKTIFRIKSPIHIGWDKFGILHKTRPYVTGRNLWGALTATLAVCYRTDDYGRIGEDVDNQLRFTYFYPSDDKEEVSLFPWADSEKFSWLYVNGYSSTALKLQLAEDSSLHEIEYISPKTREGKEVYIIGYIFEQPGNKIKWRDALNKLCIGGERSYGWGMVELVDLQPIKGQCFNLNIELDGINPKIKLKLDKKCNNLLAHTIATDESDCEGVLEPFIGRETTSKDCFGTYFSKPEICWIPGSKVKSDSSYVIDAKGLWKKHKSLGA